MSKVSLIKQAIKVKSGMPAFQTLNGSNQKTVIQQQKYQFASTDSHKYVKGFRNTHVQELVEGEFLPSHTNPKFTPHNLVTEQISGPQGFTGEAAANGPLRLWIYKKERSIKVGKYEETSKQPFHNVEYVNPGPNPIKLQAPSVPTQPTDFVEGLVPVADNDHVLHYNYGFNKSMSEQNRVFHNLDGEMLIQPSVGALEIITECGILELQPGTIGVITKNIKFQVNLKNGEEAAIGVITELKNDRSFRIPGKGPIGANGLVNPEFIETPVPFVDSANMKKTHEVLCKKQDQFYTAKQAQSPFDIYAWKGNYAPYRFNLDDFVPVTAGQKDHLDPSSHIVFAVGGPDGANFVELVAFAPRWQSTTDKQPTYLPPYDHRNNGKAEIMHYLGGYDARAGGSAGIQTIHDMGVAHGNDQVTFEKAKTGNNEPVYLNFPPATMIELTGGLRLTKSALQNVDESYGDSLRGLDAGPSSLIRPPQTKIGKMKKITFTAFESSLTQIFDVLMPNPTVDYNPKTGIVVKQYRNNSGDIFEIRAQKDQNNFWELYKSQNDQNKVTHEKRAPSEATNEELLLAASTIKSFLNRGTVVQAIDLEVEDPQKTVKYFLAKGFHQGIDANCVTLKQNAPLNFRFIKSGDFEAIPNADSNVSNIDHTVINVFRDQLTQMFDLFPLEFWGGDPRDLRATGVQFDTRVLTNQQDSVQQLIPVNNLDKTEEDILRRIQAGDTYLPPYIKKAAIGNQITRGLFDTNRTKPVASQDGFLQHIAMAVNTKFGDIAYHLKNLKSNGLNLIPPPPDAYYELSKVDLSQRVLIPTLFRLAGIDAFSLPNGFFNGLLKPKDAKVKRLNELLLEAEYTQEQADPVIACFNKVLPLLELVGQASLEFNAEQFRPKLIETLNAQNLSHTEQDIKEIISFIEFNEKKIAAAQEVGSLLDFQIIRFGTTDQSGYLDQTFSIPITQRNEGTSGIFLEFIVRTCYGEIAGLIERGKFYNEATEFKACGAFGQGNFGNLMLGQQLGIKKVDTQIKQQQAAQGFTFKMPMLDYNTIYNTPLDHMHTHIEKAAKRGEDYKIDDLSQITENLDDIIAECKKRGIWEN